MRIENDVEELIFEELSGEKYDEEKHRGSEHIEMAHRISERLRKELFHEHNQSM